MTRFHQTEIEKTKQVVRKEMEAEHLIKFSQVSKQIQSLQKTELDAMKAALQEEHSKAVEKLNARHALTISELQNTVDANTSEKAPVNGEERGEITSDIYTAMRADLDRLEEEKYNLRSMQVLMKDLMKDLAKHYDLSEKQVRLLSDSTMFESLSLSVATPMRTPAKYFTAEMLREGDALESFTAAELTEDLHQLRLDNSESSRQLLQDMMLRVKDSNSCLSQVTARLDSQLTTPRTEARQVSSSDFVGLEAGRLELEKARLESELDVALQRIQELEVGGRLSLPRSEVISGLGEAGEGQESLDIGEEVREKAQKLLAALGESEAGSVERDEVVRVLSELLVFTDSLTSKAREKVAEVEQQLEVADKQLRATRQFLEEQAAEREQEREEWDRRLVEARQDKLVLVRKGEEETVEGQEDDSEDNDEDSKQVKGLKSELSAAVEKIFELRDIIRGLESKVEQKTRVEVEQAELVRELKLSLEEAELSRQLVAGDLQRLREASSEREVVEHIRTLEEQLSTKTAELSNQKAAAGNMMEVKAQLRTMEERLEQTTRGLETLTVPGSSSSSRVSTPVPVRVEHLGSFEDIGAALSGLELEELSRLETKLKQLERAETAAKERVRLLEADNQDLQSALQSRLSDLRRAEEEMEDVQSERSVLQGRLTEQQVKISSLESCLQSTRHRPDREERLNLLAQERETLRRVSTFCSIKINFSVHKLISNCGRVDFILKGI